MSVSMSNMAAKLPLTILGDMGELASRRLEPKSSLRARVSAKRRRRDDIDEGEGEGGRKWPQDADDYRRA